MNTLLRSNSGGVLRESLYVWYHPANMDNSMVKDTCRKVRGCSLIIVFVALIVESLVLLWVTQGFLSYRRTTIYYERLVNKVAPRCPELFRMKAANAEGELK